MITGGKRRLGLLATIVLAASLLSAAPARAAGAWTISGTVNDSHGAALANVSVLLTGPGGPSAAVSDDSGHYEVTGDAGSSTLAVTRSAPAGSALGALTVTAGLTVVGDTVLDLTAPDLETLDLAVEDATGQPVPGAEVAMLGFPLGGTWTLAPGLVANKPATNPLIYTSTDGTGHVRFVLLDGAAPRTVNVRKLLPGGTYSPGSWSPSSTGNQTATVTLPFTTPRTVNGTLLDSSGLPLGGAKVDVGGAAVTTDASGAFVLTVYSASTTVSITPSNPGIGNITATFATATDTVSATIQLPPTRTYEVAVQDGSGAPVPFAQVAFTSLCAPLVVTVDGTPAGGAGQACTTLVGGTTASGVASVVAYDVPVVPRIAAQATRQGYTLVAELLGADASQPLVVVIPFPDLVTVTGTVVDSDGSLQAGVRVGFVATPAGARATTGADGTFEVTVPANATQVVVDDGSDGGSPLHWSLSSTGLALQPGVPLDLTIPARVPIAFTVTDSSGLPLAGATILATTTPEASLAPGLTAAPGVQAVVSGTGLDGSGTIYLFPTPRVGEVRVGVTVDAGLALAGIVSNLEVVEGKTIPISLAPEGSPTVIAPPDAPDSVTSDVPPPAAAVLMTSRSGSVVATRTITTASPSTTPASAPVLVTWAPPAVTGGLPVTGYRVEVVGVPGDQRVTDPSLVLVGLPLGVPQTVRVVAQNAVGPSVSPTTVTVIPGTPGRPRDVVATPAQGAVTVTWTAPPSPTAAITGYRVTLGGGIPAVQVGPGLTSVTISGLSNGSSYTPSVEAGNQYGWSAPALGAAAVPTAVSSWSGTTSPTWIAPGRACSVSARLISGASGLGATPVQLWVRPARAVTWTQQRTGVTSATGTVSLTAVTLGTVSVQLRYAGTASIASSATAVRTCTRDGVAPTVPSVTVTGSSSLRRAVVRWSSGDAGSGVAAYQVRLRSVTSGRTTWTTWSTQPWTTTTARTWSSLTRGRTYCWSVRAKDRVGLLSGYSLARCFRVT